MKSLSLVAASLGLVLSAHVAPAQHKSAANTSAPTLEEEASASLRNSSPELRQLAESSAAKFNKHDYAGAIADLNRIIAISPQLAGAYDARGMVKTVSGDLNGADADFKHAIALSPKNPDGYLGLGNLKYKRGDNAGAIAEYRRALQANPRCGPAYDNIGNVERHQKDFPKAEADYSRAIDLNANNPKAWCNRAVVRDRMDRAAEAMADVNQAIKIAPKYAPGYAVRASIKHSQGDLSGALSDYHRAIDIDPAQNGDYRAVAFIEAQQGRYAPALEDARRSVQSSKSTALDYSQILAWSLRTRLGQSADADRELSAYSAGRTRAAEGEWSGHIIAFLLGREPEDSLFAHAKSGDAKAVEGQRCEAWYYAGLKKSFAGDKATAAADFRQSVATGQRSYFEYQLAQAELRTR